MCGIVGYISKNNYTDTLTDKLEEIKHRGPDSNGIYEYRSEEFNIGLGHVRLSIIDLSEGAKQPFISNCNRYILTFNGEIYNYKALRDKYLDKKELTTSSDTEVLLNLYILKGKKILNELSGMFAFAIYDTVSKTTFIARDQLGIKPLYYYVDSDKFIFSSEIKAIWKFKGVTKKINDSLYTEFLLNGFLYEPDTGFVGVKKLELGTYVTINSKLEQHFKKYWHLNAEEKNINDEVNSLDSDIENSIIEHLESDVPVGLFFSGGVDSTIILDKVKDNVKPVVVKSSTEDLKFSGQTNDYYYANKVAELLKVNLESITLTESINSNEEFLRQIDYLSIATEEPISDFTFISSQKISEKSKKLGYTVMLSGMGADEIFGGYPRYKVVRFEKIFRLINTITPDFLLKNKSFEKKIQRFRNYFKHNNFGLKYASLIGYFSTTELDKLIINGSDTTDYQNKTSKLLNDLHRASNLKKAMFLDLYGFLSHNFSVADKSSMLHNLELRVPLATKNLIEKTFQIKSKSLLKLRDTKVILKKILLKANYPKHIIYRKKAGFNPPLDNLIRGLGVQKIDNVLQNNGFYEIFNQEFIGYMLSKHFNRKENNTYKIFQLLYLSYWIKNNKKGI